MSRFLNAGKIEKSPNSNLGFAGEDFVAEVLQNAGYKIVCKNYRKRFGEVDLIAKSTDLIAFVEVKTRTTNYFNLSEVVNLTKQRRIILAAKDFLISNNISDVAVRFDVALVNKSKSEYELEYIENAFTDHENE